MDFLYRSPTRMWGMRFSCTYAQRPHNAQVLPYTAAPTPAMQWLIFSCLILPYTEEFLASDWGQQNHKYVLNVFRSWWNRHSLHIYMGSIELPRLMPPGTSSSAMQTHAAGFGLCAVLEKVGDRHGREEGNFPGQQPAFPKGQGCHPRCLTGSRGLFGATLGLALKRHLEELHVCRRGREAASPVELPAGMLRWDCPIKSRTLSL